MDREAWAYLVLLLIIAFGTAGIVHEVRERDCNPTVTEHYKGHNDVDFLPEVGDFIDYPGTVIFGDGGPAEVMQVGDGVLDPPTLGTLRYERFPTESNNVLSREALSNEHNGITVLEAEGNVQHWEYAPALKLNETLTLGGTGECDPLMEISWKDDIIDVTYGGCTTVTDAARLFFEHHVKQYIDDSYILIRKSDCTVVKQEED